MATRNLAILFSDIKGFTERTSAATREGVRSLLASHERLLLPVFRHFEGTIVKTLGDAFLVTFDSPTDAVLCGMAIQEVLAKHNAAAVEDERLEVRIAINQGEVEIRDGDVFGEPVNITSRLEGITEPCEVYFTEAVYLSMNRREVPSAAIGERTFKGIPYPVRVYKVIRERNSPESIRFSEAIRLTADGPVIEGLRAPTGSSEPAPDAGIPRSGDGPPEDDARGASRERAARLLELRDRLASGRDPGQTSRGLPTRGSEVAIGLAALVLLLVLPGRAPAEAVPIMVKIVVALLAATGLLGLAPSLLDEGSLRARAAIASVRRTLLRGSILLIVVMPLLVIAGSMSDLKGGGVETRAVETRKIDTPGAGPSTGVSDAEAFEKAKRLLAKGEVLTALAFLEAPLRRDPTNLPLRDLALQAARAEIEQLRKSKTAEEIPAWVEKQIETHPYLEGLRKDLPRLETEAALVPIVEGRARGMNREPFEKAFALARKYPNDPEIPFLAANILDRRYAIGAVFGLYEEAVKRGHDRNDPEIVGAWKRVLAEYTPEHDEAIATRAFVKAQYGNEPANWALSAFDAGTGSAYLNALAILREGGYPRAREPFQTDLECIVRADPRVGTQPMGTSPVGGPPAESTFEVACRHLEAITDPTRGRRALAIVAGRVGEGDLRDTAAVLLGDLAVRLAGRFGGTR